MMRTVTQSVTVGVGGAYPSSASEYLELRFKLSMLLAPCFAQQRNRKYLEQDSFHVQDIATMAIWDDLPFELKSMILRILIHNMVDEAAASSRLCQPTTESIKLYNLWEGDDHGNVVIGMTR